MPSKKAMKDNDRAFVIDNSSVGYSGGRYVAQTAQGAAQHAAKILFRMGKKSESKITFSLRECTRGSKQKTYKYKAVVELRKPPITWIVTDKKTGKKKELVSTHVIKVHARGSTSTED